MGLGLEVGSLSWPPAVVATANASGDANANARHDAAADAADAAAVVAS